MSLRGGQTVRTPAIHLSRDRRRLIGRRVRARSSEPQSNAYISIQCDDDTMFSSVSPPVGRELFLVDSQQIKTQTYRTCFRFKSTREKQYFFLNVMKRFL